jgi:hypothetical protein
MAEQRLFKEVSLHICNRWRVTLFLAQVQCICPSVRQADGRDRNESLSLYGLDISDCCAAPPDAIQDPTEKNRDLIGKLNSR